MVRVQLWPVLFLTFNLFLTLECIAAKNQRKGAAKYTALSGSKTARHKSVAAFGFPSNFGSIIDAGKKIIPFGDASKKIIDDAAKNSPIKPDQFNNVIKDITNNIPVVKPDQINKIIIDGMEKGKELINGGKSIVSNFTGPIGDIISKGTEQAANIIADGASKISDIAGQLSNMTSGNGTWPINPTDLISNFTNNIINVITNGTNEAAQFLSELERRKMEALCNLGEMGRGMLFNQTDQFRKGLANLEHMKLGLICNVVNWIGDMIFNGTEQLSNFTANLERMKMDMINRMTEQGIVTILNGTEQLSDAMRMNETCNLAENGNGTSSEMQPTKNEMCSIANQLANGTRQGSQSLAELDRMKMRILTDITNQVVGFLFGVTGEGRKIIMGLERMKMQMFCGGMKDLTDGLSKASEQAINTIADMERKKMDVMCKMADDARKGIFNGTSQDNKGSGIFNIIPMPG